LFVWTIVTVVTVVTSEVFSMSVETLTEGSIFSGRYKILRRIAAGGMGAVYEVLHDETARRRALKVMHPHLAESDDFRSRFQTEARIAGQVDSRYIVDVFDAGVDEATKMPFLVMELLQGEELGKRLRRVGRFGFEETVGYLWQTALALDKTHRANIVHRDLKPDNLFLCESEDGPPLIKVLDFGIAKLMAEGGTQANVTRAMGTPLYMAPEQFKSKSKVSPATDIHALGMMAYMMLVGVPYWADELATEDNPYAFAGIVMQGPPELPSVRALRRGIRLPGAFDEWFAQATSPKPEQRFFKATVAIKGLAQALGVDVLATPKGYSTSGADPQALGVVTGQTSPGQTGSGQTGSTGTSSSGPQGTVVLESVPPPVEAPTNSGTYGLSTSAPKVASISSIPSIPSIPSITRTETPPAQPAIPVPRRTRQSFFLVPTVIGLATIGVSVFVFGGKKQALDPTIATSAPMSGTGIVASAMPEVTPVDMVPPVDAIGSPVISLSVVTPPVVAVAISAAPIASSVSSVLLQRPPGPKGTSTSPRKTKYTREY
jgi:eukaryotic-like serine/threonine-protein kinase